MPDPNTQAPGAPGIGSRWTSSAKSGIGAALSPYSHVTFTLSHGILNEIYYPQIDLACTRDMGLLIVDGRDYFSEEKRHCSFKVNLVQEGIPAYHLVNTSLDGEYVIEKDIFADPWRDSVLQRVRFRPLRRPLSDFRLLSLLAPHIANQGMNNTAWLGDYKSVHMIFAERDGIALAFASLPSWNNRSVGFVGTSDGWQDANQHKRMTWSYPLAEKGNVALTGEMDPSTCNGTFTVAIGFGRNHTEAAFRALSSIKADFDELMQVYISEWEHWFGSHRQTGSAAGKKEMSKFSLGVLRIHEDKITRGGIIASTSIPWGQAKGDDDLGGYHLVWIRDQIEAAVGMLAAGVRDDVRWVLQYLRATQEADGGWPQNMWLDGRSFWTGIQMDEISFPILLLDLMRRENSIRDEDVPHYYDMVRRAASFIVRNGPVTQQDRWEEEAGYSPFTLAVEISALLAAADMMDHMNDHDDADYLRQTADYWNSSIERWCYVTGTDTAKQAGVDGYYVRIAPPDIGEAASIHEGFVPIKHRAPGSTDAAAENIVSTDALALVRFGLRDAQDPRIVNTVKVIDRVLKVDTPFGPVWHRFNHDVYGEYPDGSAYDGGGVGRGWPLLTGERGHYEVAAGHLDEARKMLDALHSFAGDVGLIPEQVWDSADIPELELSLGRPSGSAMPLAWAHSEHIRLTRSIGENKVFDLPRHTVERYSHRDLTVGWACWRFNNKLREISAGLWLRIEILAPARIRWSFDNWQTANETEARATALGIYYSDLGSEKLSPGQTISFTFYWKDSGNWEGRNFDVSVIGS